MQQQAMRADRESVHRPANISRPAKGFAASNTSPSAALQRRAVAANASPQVNAQLRLSSLMNDGPDAAVQRRSSALRIAQRMTIGTDVIAADDVFESIKGSREGRAFIAARDEESLRSWLRDRDSHTFPTRNNLLAAVKKAASESTDTGPTRESVIKAGSQLVGPSIVQVLQDGRKADEVYYKIGLCRQLGGSDDYLIPFAQRMIALAGALERGAPIERAVIQRTFDLLTSPWPKPPSYYLQEKEGIDSLTGGEKGGGIPLAFRGINSELDAILNVRPDELADDEVVFNASTYTDPAVREMTKDVDVSYIDSNGVLNLIESGKDMKTLYNKVSGNHDQKAIYAHLTHNAASIEHAPVGPLTERQSERNTISGVAWWYNVPPETLSLDTSVPEIRASISAMAKAGAGLRSGDQRWTPEQLRTLL